MKKIVTALVALVFVLCGCGVVQVTPVAERCTKAETGNLLVTICAETSTVVLKEGIARAQYQWSDDRYPNGIRNNIYPGTPSNNRVIPSGSRYHVQFRDIPYGETR